MRVRKVAVLVPVVALLAYASLTLYGYATDDDITRAGRETRRLLNSPALLESREQTHTWLITNHGEAAGSEVMNVFVSWACDHPRNAEFLMSNFPARQQPDLARRVGRAAVDSGQEEAFVTTYKETTSQFFGRVLAEIGQRRSTTAPGISSNR